jgi:hypothetical protein
MRAFFLEGSNQQSALPSFRQHFASHGKAHQSPQARMPDIRWRLGRRVGPPLSADCQLLGARSSSVDDLILPEL